MLSRVLARVRVPPDPAALERVVGLLRRRRVAFDRLSYGPGDSDGERQILVSVHSPDPKRLVAHLTRIHDVLRVDIEPVADE